MPTEAAVQTGYEMPVQEEGLPSSVWLGSRGPAVSKVQRNLVAWLRAKGRQGEAQAFESACRNAESTYGQAYFGPQTYRYVGEFQGEAFPGKTPDHVVGPLTWGKLSSAQPTPAPGPQPSPAPAPQPTAPVRQVGQVMTEAEISQVLTQSPLRSRAIELARHIAMECARTGVPAWLVLGQMEFETSFGSTVNCTVQTQRAILVRGVRVRTGCAYNLFNITTPNLQTGEYLHSGTGVNYRAYGSFQESITDYCNLLARYYRDLPCWAGGRSFIEKYFPLWQNGEARQREYFATLQRAARRWGKTAITSSTVLLPSR